MKVFYALNEASGTTERNPTPHYLFYSSFVGLFFLFRTKSGSLFRIRIHILQTSWIWIRNKTRVCCAVFSAAGADTPGVCGSAQAPLRTLRQVGPAPWPWTASWSGKYFFNFYQREFKRSIGQVCVVYPTLGSSVSVPRRLFIPALQ